MTILRIKNAIEIIYYAIKNNISVKEASKKFGFADTYVKNTKRNLIQAYEAGLIAEDDYSAFMSTYKKYVEMRNTPQNSHVNFFVNKENFNDKLDDLEPVNGEKLNINQNDDTIEIDWKNGPSESQNLNEDENTTNFSCCKYPKNHIKTLDDLIKECKINLDEWKVVRHIVNKWDVTSWRKGYPETWENFQVKASLEKIKEVHQAKELSQIFKELINEYEPPIVTPIISKTQNVISNENNLLEISLFDLHFGKLGWAGEVGENFDTKIAYARFIDAINNLLQRAQGFQVSKILFPIGNDFFNSDNKENTTAAGTPQEEDLRWQKTFKLGCDLIIKAITLLKSRNVPIEVLVIPGNHDWERSYYLGCVLEAWFKNDLSVKIDNSAFARKYYNHGNVLLGFTHGKEEKETSLPMLMAIERPEIWGKSKFREWHLGHFHKKKGVKYSVSLNKDQVFNEDDGVIVRYLSSLSGLEDWHYRKGYVGSYKAGEAFIWNDKSGMVAHLNFNFTDYNREL